MTSLKRQYIFVHWARSMITRICFGLEKVSSFSTSLDSQIGHDTAPSYFWFVCSCSILAGGLCFGKGGPVWCMIYLVVRLSRWWLFTAWSWPFHFALSYPRRRTTNATRIGRCCRCLDCSLNKNSPGNAGALNWLRLGYTNLSRSAISTKKMNINELKNIKSNHILSQAWTILMDYLKIVKKYWKRELNFL